MSRRGDVMSDKQYRPRDSRQLDRDGDYYCRHVAAMTREGLHEKSDIAAELAYRDREIDRLRAELERVRRERIGGGSGMIDNATEEYVDALDHITMGFARRDDCLDRLVPSDLRVLIGERDHLRAENERLREGEQRSATELLDEYERQTKALPVQHEIPSRGCATYNWRMAVIRDLRRMIERSPQSEQEGKNDE